MKFSTRAIHAGQEPDPTTGAVCTPIYQTSTYVQEGLNKHKGYEYARTQNPTREALEECLASMEGGKYGLCFGSGLAAEGCTVGVFDINQAGAAETVGAIEAAGRKAERIRRQQIAALAHLGREEGLDHRDGFGRTGGEV